MINVFTLSIFPAHQFAAISPGNEAVNTIGINKPSVSNQNIMLNNATLSSAKLAI